MSPAGPPGGPDGGSGRPAPPAPPVRVPAPEPVLDLPTVPAPAVPPVRMIATDLDGTLLRRDGSLAPRVRAALLAAQEAGIEVVPATGRPRMVAGDVIAELPFVHHWVFANGSVTWHAGRSELVRGFWLDPAEVRQLVRSVRAVLPTAGFAVEFEESMAYEPPG